MSTFTRTHPAVKAAVDDLVRDLTGRSQGDWWWDPIDATTKQEIKRTWAQIIARHLRQSVEGRSR